MKKDSYDLISAYEKLRKKYSLPEYRELSQDFNIEKLNEKESDYLLRNIRKVIDEKLSAYMNFFEIIINPSLPTLFIFQIIKKIDSDIRKKINKNYKVLSKFQIESMKLDTLYDEKSEAGFIKEIFSEWQKLKKEIYDLIENFEYNLEENEEGRKESYFG